MTAIRAITRLQDADDLATPVDTQFIKWNAGASQFQFAAVTGSSPFYDVTTYGADKTGATDSSSAIQSAINAASTGGVVFFPPGSYKLSTGLTVTNNVQVNLWGDGATLKPDATVTAIRVTQSLGNPAIGCEIKGFIIDGQSHSTTIGIELKDTDGAQLKNLHFTSLTTAIHFNVSNATATWVERTTLMNILIISCTTGILMERTGGSGLASFAESCFYNVGISTCTTGIQIGTNTEPHRMNWKGVVVWLPTGGTGLNFLGGDYYGCELDVHLETLPSTSSTTGISIGSGCTNWEFSDFHTSWVNTFTTYLSNASAIRFPFGNGEPNMVWHGIRVFHNASQSIPNNARTAVAFNSERFRSRTDYHNTSTNNSRITIPVLCQGMYRITFNGEFANNTTGQRNFEIRLNGSTMIAVAEIQNLSTRNCAATVTCDYYLNDGDYVEATVFQDSGGSLNLNASANYSPEFSVIYVGK